MIIGLKYISNYITKLQERSFIKIIDASQWLELGISRKIQHYGYRYDYKTNVVTNDDYIGQLPDWLMDICKDLIINKIFTILPNQVIINNYEPGQGITSHIDADCFDPTICSLSLRAKCVMDFTKGPSHYPHLLERRSLLILSEEARHSWKHGIKNVKKKHL